MPLIRLRVLIPMLAAFMLLASSLAAPAASALPARQGACLKFNETGKSVCGRFLEYWTGSGGLAQQGFPLSEVMQERSDTDGKVYATQYFERAVFEAHPENQRPYDVLLSLLGVFEYANRYGAAGAPNQKASTSNAIRYNQTGKTLGGKFRTYWEGHGGLAQQGYPISDEFTETSALNGKTYLVQYFERAVFELHPENQPPYDVLLSQLGKFQYDRKHSSAQASVTPAPTPTAANQEPTWVGIGDIVRRNGVMFTVYRADFSAKQISVNFQLANESAGTLNFTLANADQRLVDGSGKSYLQIEPDRRVQVTLARGQSYRGATGFMVNLGGKGPDRFTYAIENLPGVGSIRVDVPVGEISP